MRTMADFYQLKITFFLSSFYFMAPDSSVLVFNYWCLNNYFPEMFQNVEKIEKIS